MGRSSTVALLTLAACVAVWYVLIRSQQDSIKKTWARKVAAEDQANRANQLIAAGPGIERDLQETTAFLKTREEGMASGDLYAWMVQTIARLKLVHKVDIPQIGRETPCEVGAFAQFPCKAAMLPEKCQA